MSDKLAASATFTMVAATHLVFFVKKNYVKGWGQVEVGRLPC